MPFQVIRRNKVGGHLEITVPAGNDVVVPYWIAGVHSGNEAWMTASSNCTIRFTLEHSDVLAAFMNPVDLSAGNNSYIHSTPAAVLTPPGFGFNASNAPDLMWGAAIAATANAMYAVPLTATGVRITTTTNPVRIIIAGAN